MPAPRKSLFSSMASTSSHARLPEALLAWVRSLPATQRLLDDSDLPRKVDDLNDLNDGVVLGQILLDIDSDHFQPLAAMAGSLTSKALRENWVLRFNHLKRLYKLVIRYFEDALSSSTTELHTPNLQLVAKGRGADGTGDEDGADELCKLAGLVLAVAVQSDEHRLEHVERIQSLEEWVQAELMYSIEQVMSKVEKLDSSDRDKTLEFDADSEFYQIQHEKSRLMHDKESLQASYSELVKELNQLKDEHEDALSTIKHAEQSAQDDARARSELAKETLKNEHALKLEIDRFRTQLQTAVNQLGETEETLARRTRENEALSAKVAELTPIALEATKLKDQLDEAKHVVEKSKKMENVLDKYKKKVEESAEWKRVIKTLEEENSDLLDKNTVLQEQLDKASTASSSSSSRPNVVESYKSHLSAASVRTSELERDKERLERELERTQRELEQAREDHATESEAVVALQEKLAQLELVEGDDEAGRRGGVGSELDNALSSATLSKTDLKLRIRKLERQLAESEELLGESRIRCEQLEQQGPPQPSSSSSSSSSTLLAQIASLEDKLQKAKTFIKSQDKLLKAEISAQYEEAMQSQSSEITRLGSDLARQKAMAEDLDATYRREHDLILSAWHDNAMRHLRQQVFVTDRAAAAGGGEREYQPQSWIRQQRVRANGKPLRNA